MTGYGFSPRAPEDLNGIWDYSEKHWDAVRKLDATQLALVGSLVHNQGRAEGKPAALIEILGNDTREVVEVLV